MPILFPFFVKLIRHFLSFAQKTIELIWQKGKGSFNYSRQIVPKWVDLGPVSIFLWIGAFLKTVRWAAVCLAASHMASPLLHVPYNCF
jgi:hypothetical protein